MLEGAGVDVETEASDEEMMIRAYLGAISIGFLVQRRKTVLKIHDIPAVSIFSWKSKVGTGERGTHDRSYHARVPAVSPASVVRGSLILVPVHKSLWARRSISDRWRMYALFNRSGVAGREVEST